MEVFLCFASGDTKHFEKFIGREAVEKVEQLGRNELSGAILTNVIFAYRIIGVSLIERIFANVARSHGIAQANHKARKIRAL